MARLGLGLLLVWRGLSSFFWAVQTDCDEVFNYWEPTRFLYATSAAELAAAGGDNLRAALRCAIRECPKHEDMHLRAGVTQKGLQTWEYSPRFALRSYLYAIPFALVARLLKLLTNWGDARLYFAVRTLLSLCCGGSEIVLIQAMRKRFGNTSANTLTFLLAASPGIFQASHQLVPSSTCLVLGNLVTAAFLLRKTALAISLSLISTIVCWPFVAFLYIPMGAWLLVSDLRRSVRVGIVVSSAVCLVMLLVDASFYGRLVLAPYNILRYNVAGGQSLLYGVEGADFYLKNLALNFNVQLLLAAVGGLSCCSAWFEKKSRGGRAGRRDLLVIAAVPVIAWIYKLNQVPHKEERFLYPVYASLAVLASAGVDSIREWSRKWRVRGVTLALFGVIAVMGVLRIAAIHVDYGAPVFDTWTSAALRQHPKIVSATSESPAIICIGADWYRFPSSFFLPPHSEIHFVRANFRGILPGWFTHTNTSDIGTNDKNQEVLERYSPLNSCDFVVDSTEDEDGVLLDESVRANHSGEDVMAFAPLECHWVLDAQRSRALWRSFAMPSRKRYLKHRAFCVWAR